jgi:hypothetical protein
MSGGSEQGFEEILRSYAGPIASLRVRPANRDILLSLNSVEDFVLVSRAATSANIRVELSYSFGGAKHLLDISRCVLRLVNTEIESPDVAFLLCEVLRTRLEQGKIEPNLYERLSSDLLKAHSRDEEKNL